MSFYQSNGNSFFIHSSVENGTLLRENYGSSPDFEAQLGLRLCSVITKTLVVAISPTVRNSTLNGDNFDRLAPQIKKEGRAS